MGGKILEYEAKDILNRGKQEGKKIGEKIGEERGHAVGRMESILQSVEQVMKNLSVDLQEACRILGITPEEYEKAKMLR